MKNYYIHSILLASTFSQVSLQSLQGSGRLSIKVYYESRCIDSQIFMTKQLNPVWSQLRDMIDVDLIAYGKAEGSGEFLTCHHDEEECRDHRLLACARAHLSDRRSYVNYTLCALTHEESRDPFKMCAEQQGIDQYDDILRCADTEDGKAYLHNLGQMQRSEAPGLDYVPWIMLNGERTIELQDSAENDLLRLVCQEFGAEKPSVCLGDTNIL